MHAIPWFEIPTTDLSRAKGFYSAMLGFAGDQFRAFEGGPVSMAIFVTGVLYYLYTFIDSHRFTNMSALLITTSVTTFMLGILAELVSALHYKEADAERRLARRTPPHDE